MKTYLVRPHAEEKQGWKVEAEGAREPQACTGRNPRWWRRSWRGAESSPGL
jgi:hypothetical protein